MRDFRVGDPMVKLVHDDVEQVLSTARLQYWTRVAGGDPQRGLVLHNRNTLIAGILYADLQVLEVALRNSFDREMRKEFGVGWPNLPEFDDDKRMEFAKKRARETSGGLRHDKMMVNLQFSFWSDLLKPGKFRPVVGRAFYHGDVHKFYRGLKSLVRLRHDIAHHEPVIDRDGTRRSQNLQSDLKMLNSILSSLAPKLGEWLELNSSIQKLMKSGFVSCGELKHHLVEIYVP
jgi:hypothetical protein